MRYLILIFFISLSLEATTMQEIFDALKNHTQAKLDIAQIQEAKEQKEVIDSSLYPRIELFGSYDNYSEATSMVPIPPNEMMKMVKDSSVSQPFGYNIFREGAKFSMPVFAKSIYTLSKKAKIIQKSAKAKKRLNLIRNEALIVGANANLLYLSSLLQSLHAKETSLLESKKITKIKVDNGRSPASALYKIDDALNDLSIAKNNIELQKRKLISSIEALSGIVLNDGVKMEQKGDIDMSCFGILEPLKDSIRAQRLDVKVQKEKFYPALIAHGSYTFLQTEAYNNHKNISKEYGNIGLTLNIPILQMQNYSEVSLSKVKLSSSRLKLKQTEDEIKAEAKMIKDSLILLDNSIKLYKKSIKNKKELLKIAKTSYKNGRLPSEEYLRYEDDVVSQEAKLYEAQAQKWQLLMRMAVIYGNDIEEIVR